MAKRTIQKESSTTHNKNYSYKKGTIQLSFSLNDDGTTEMQDFLDCLIEAARDVERDIKEMRN